MSSRRSAASLSLSTSVVVAIGFALAACGDDDVRTFDQDTGPADTGSTDLGPRDAGLPEDLGPEDTGPRDSGPPDTGPEPDAGPPEEPCDTPGMSEDLLCGRCGTQTRFCTSRRVWEISPCEGEHGDCDPGTTGMLACGDTEVAARCSDVCVLVPRDPEARCPLAGCEAPLELDARAGETVSIPFDTTFGEPGPFDLAPCASGPPGARPPQVVVAVHMPGSARRSVSFTTVNDATDPAFDTDVVLLPSPCAAPAGGPGARCFPETLPDMTGVGDIRASGRFGADGGDTIYLLVTGSPFASGVVRDRDRGRGRLDVTVGESVAPPTLRSATLQSSPESTVLRFEGGDLDADAAFARVTFLDASGMPVDFDGNGTVDAVDDRPFFPDVPITGMVSFSATAPEPGSFISERLAMLGARRARVRVVDELGQSSPELTIDVALVTLAGFGESCDAMRACRTPLVCAMGRCAAAPEATALCTGATAITLSGTPATGMVTGTLLPGASLFDGGCGSTGTGGAELLYRVTVPAGSWDLVASTRMGTAMGTDTVLYVRRVCGDPTSMLGCVDDAGGDVRSHIELNGIAPGEHTIIVERYSGVPTGTMVPVTLSVTLRPVLAAGAMCDPMGVANRCSTGACTGGTCPPAPPPPP